MEHVPGAAALAACAALLTVPVAAQETTVARPVQAARDDERMRILRAELQRERALATDATRRRAERHTAGDGQGARDAEQQQLRATDNVVALQREIVAAERGANPPRRHAGTAPGARPTAVRWWDVYAPRPSNPSTASARRPN